LPSIKPNKPGFRRKVFGPSVHLGPEPLTTGLVMFGLDIILLISLVFYSIRRKRQEQEEALQSKVTQDQETFGG
jgi:hypothetical protein